MNFMELSAKTAKNVEETIEEMVGNIIEKGFFEIRKEKLALGGDRAGGRKDQNDTCCG